MTSGQATKQSHIHSFKLCIFSTGFTETAPLCRVLLFACVKNSLQNFKDTASRAKTTRLTRSPLKALGHGILGDFSVDQMVIE